LGQLYNLLAGYIFRKVQKKHNINPKNVMAGERPWKKDQHGVEFDLGPTRPKKPGSKDLSAQTGSDDTQPMDEGPSGRARRAPDPEKKEGKGQKTIPLGLSRLSEERSTDGGDVFDPVVGWLVCTKGPARGRAFELRSARNFVGRSQDMHVALAGDPRISRDKHAIVTYDPKQNGFVLQQGESSTQLVYLNGEAVYDPRQLSRYDQIELGDTELLFVPLCDDEFTWETGRNRGDAGE